MINSIALQNIVLGATKRSDIVVAIFIMLIIVLMILPIPTFLVDILIAFNMSASVVLIMVGVYLPSPLSFSAFPAVLLLTTLFRLALSITTTRLILLQADAGAIVESFGNFVVGGNMVVGMVVFLIITIVQFIVITKGSERVAEVGARFSLDAMPGKQMSIDGDMRSGVIDQDEASEKRRSLERESQLYGAMDGAMKFVKGDAIAGIIIIIVNILGGIAIGTMQQGLSAGEAAQLYSILTVGDGLVAQIPALLISITAGIIVTRVAVDETSNIGADITTQVLAQPKALMISSALLLGFGLIPGFPTTVFFALALLVGGVGFVVQAIQTQDEEGDDSFSRFTNSTGTPSSERAAGSVKSAEMVASEFSVSVPLVIEVPPSMKESLNAADLNRELANTRRALYHDLGIPFPGIDLTFAKELPDGTYRILLDEVPVAQGKIRLGNVLVQEPTETLELLGFDYSEGETFLPDVDSVWVSSDHVDSIKEAELRFMEPSHVITYHLSFVLRRYSGEFIGIQETRSLIERMEEDYPELVKEVQRLIPIQKMSDIFKRLVSEDVSIRNMRQVLQALVEWGQSEKDPILLTEYVRSNLKRHISFKYSGGQNILAAYMLDPSVEEVVRNGIRQTASGSYLALEPEQSKALLESVHNAVGDLKQHLGKPVVLTSMDVRRYVRRLLETDYYDLPVLSYQEITSEITVQPIERISM